MSMFNDIIWVENHKVANDARRLPRCHWSFLGLGSEKKWYKTYSDKPDGIWDKTVEKMMIELSETAHATFRASIAFEGGEENCQAKEGARRLSI